MKSLFLLTFIIIVGSRFCLEPIGSGEIEELITAARYVDIYSKICPMQNQCLADFDAKTSGPFPSITPIGSGTFGKVFNYNDQTVLKVQETSDLELGLNILREVNIGIKIKLNNHNYLAQVTDCCLEDRKVNNMDGNRFFIYIKKYPMGDLRKFLKKGNKGTMFSPQWKFSIIMCSIEGLVLMHNAAYVHRDLKPENILLTDKYKSVLSDFGLVVKLKGNEHVSDVAAGTLGYIPPEGLPDASIRKKAVISRAFDIYSLGVIIFEVMNAVGYKINIQTVHQDILEYCDIQFIESRELLNWERHFYCVNVHPLVIQMIDSDPQKRPKISDVKDHFLGKFKDFVELMNLLKKMKEEIEMIDFEVGQSEFARYMPHSRIVI